RDKWHRPHFVQAGAHQCVLNASRHRNERRVGHGTRPERAQIRRKGIVAAETSYLLGEVNISFDIVTPTGWRDLEDVFCLGGDPESHQPEILFHFGCLDGLAQMPSNTNELERDWLGALWQRIQVDRTPLRYSAGNGKNQPHRVINEPGNGIDVDPALEPIAGLGRYRELPSRSRNSGWVECRDLEKNLGRVFGQFAAAAADHARDRLRALRVP